VEEIEKMAKKGDNFFLRKIREEGVILFRR
jgi:hypothetical protein